jgi:predicted GNAT superfamily acetyltransferase
MEIKFRECTTFEDLSACVDLQREVFALPEIELSPVRHLIVTKHAGGWTLGAFHENNLVGFVLSVPAFLRGEKAFYSHMTAVKKEFQSYGIGGKLKWLQRERALQENVKFIKWTFQPVQARNAFFNLEKLGVIIQNYKANGIWKTKKLSLYRTAKIIFWKKRRKFPLKFRIIGMI